MIPVILVECASTHVFIVCIFFCRTLSNNPMGLLRSGAFKGYSSEIQEL